jgi:tRNA A37 threonylcarbamoyladenosine biosynthesis protein TsaE
MRITAGKIGSDTYAVIKKYQSQLLSFCSFSLYSEEDTENRKCQIDVILRTEHEKWRQSIIPHSQCCTPNFVARLFSTLLS